MKSCFSEKHEQCKICRFDEKKEPICYFLKAIFSWKNVMSKFFQFKFSRIVFFNFNIWHVEKFSNQILNWVLFLFKIWHVENFTNKISDRCLSLIQSLTRRKSFFDKPNMLWNYYFKTWFSPFFRYSWNSFIC